MTLVFLKILYWGRAATTTSKRNQAQQERRMVLTNDTDDNDNAVTDSDHGCLSANIKSAEIDTNNVVEKQHNDQVETTKQGVVASSQLQHAPSRIEVTPIFHELDQKISLELFKEYEKIANEQQQCTNRDDSTRQRIFQSSNISIQDPNFDITTVRTIEPTLIDILEGWQQLIQILHQENVFSQYISNLERAFRAVHATTTLYGTAIKTLMDLLLQSAQNHSHDMSIECRFVTLLEIILSYDNPRWEPSDAVKTIWIRLLQRIPTNITPTNFRRKAYRVLVSLSWVPSSKGLLSACSFDETKQLPIFRKDRINNHMSKISNNGQYVPLPRHDSVNQLLDRLKDETDVCVAITSEKEGMGKTTLAGQVASHPSIVRVFTVLWLDIKQQKLTFDSYISHLKDLCQQLEITEPEWPTSLQRFEEPAIRQLRELGSMTIAKSIMSTMTEQHGKNLLLVLDDVLDADTMQWFRFTEQQSMIVTTPKHANFDGVDWTLDLLPMSHEEATELFLNEAGLSPEHTLGRTVELRAIVQHCDCHPLTIRTIARWFLLKQVTAGMICATQEILNDLQSLADAHMTQMCEPKYMDDPNELIFDLLSLMMGPLRRNEADTQSVLFVLCFSAMVVVFPDVAPLDSVILLWEQILKKEVLATDEIGGALPWKELSRYVWLIAEGLTHMGIISIVELDGWYVVQVHHHIYEEFGILIAKEMGVKETFHHTTVDWHKYFVTGYMAKKSNDVKENHDSTWKYMVEKLPSHMLNARMVSTAKIVLNQEEFFRARIEALGWKRGIEIQIQDCVQLQHRLENDLGKDDEPEAHASRVFNRTSILIRETKVGLSELTEEDRCESVAKALYLLGFALTENGFFLDALIYLEMAESIPHESQTLQTKIAYATCWCFLAENQTTQAKRNVESIQISSSQDKVWLNKEIFQLKAAILLAACNYRAAKILLEDFLNALKDDEANNCIELAMAYDKLGRLYFLMGEYNLAKNTLTNCIDRKHEMGEVSRSLSSTLGILGDVNVELGLFNDAKENYVAAIEALKTLRCNEQHLDYRFITGKIQFINNEFTSCYASFDLVRRTSNAAPLKVYDQSAYDLRFIARVYYELGDIEQSTTVVLESLNMTRNRPLSLERANGMIALGKCYLKSGMNRQALSYFQQAREIQMGKLGVYGNVVDTTNLVGRVHMKLNAITDAIAVFKKNYEEATKAIPEDTYRLTETVYLLSNAYETEGSYLEAINCCETCLTVICLERSHDHPDISRMLQRLGDLSTTCDDYGKAMEFLTKALAIRRENFDRARIVETQTSIGILLRKQEKFDIALNYLCEAFELSKSEDDSKSRHKVLLELGLLYRLLSNFDKAHEMYCKCIDTMEKDGGMYGQVLMSLGHLKFSQGNYSGASCDYETALLNLTETYGSDDQRTFKAIRSLGLAKFLSGNSDGAYEHFDAYTQNKGKTKSSAVDDFLVHVFKGDVLCARLDYEAATAAWNHAMNVISDSNSGNCNIPEWMVYMVESRVKLKDEEFRDRNFGKEIRNLILIEKLH